MQIEYLLSKLSNLRGVRVAIHFGSIFNISSTTSIFEGIKCLLEVDLGWGNAGNHRGSRITTKTILKNTGQF